MKNISQKIVANSVVSNSAYNNRNQIAKPYQNKVHIYPRIDEQEEKNFEKLLCQIDQNLTSAFTTAIDFSKIRDDFHISFDDEDIVLKEHICSPSFLNTSAGTIIHNIGARFGEPRGSCWRTGYSKCGIQQIRTNSSDIYVKVGFSERELMEIEKNILYAKAYDLIQRPGVSNIFAYAKNNLWHAGAYSHRNYKVILKSLSSPQRVKKHVNEMLNYLSTVFFNPNFVRYKRAEEFPENTSNLQLLRQEIQPNDALRAFKTDIYTLYIFLNSRKAKHVHRLNPDHRAELFDKIGRLDDLVSQRISTWSPVMPYLQDSVDRHIIKWKARGEDIILTCDQGNFSKAIKLALLELGEPDSETLEMLNNYKRGEVSEELEALLNNTSLTDRDIVDSIYGCPLRSLGQISSNINIEHEINEKPVNGGDTLKNYIVNEINETIDGKFRGIKIDLFWRRHVNAGNILPERRFRISFGVIYALLLQEIFRGTFRDITEEGIRDMEQGRLFDTFELP